MPKKDEADGELASELLRILGEGRHASANEILMVLPLVNAEDAVAFLKTVPDGADPQVIQEMVAQYRLDNPLTRHRRDSSDVDKG